MEEVMKLHNLGKKDKTSLLVCAPARIACGVNSIDCLM